MSARGWSIALRVALVLSLLVNAVVLGLWLRLSRVADELNGGSDGLRGLPRDVRQALRAEARDRRPEVTAAMARVGAARAAMFAAATATPYDRAAVEAAMVEVRAASQALQTLGQSLLLDALDGGGR